MAPVHAGGTGTAGGFVRPAGRVIVGVVAVIAAIAAAVWLVVI